MNFIILVVTLLLALASFSSSTLQPFEETCTAVLRDVQYELGDPKGDQEDHLSLKCETQSGIFYNLPFADQAYIKENFLNDGPYESGVTQMNLGLHAMIDMDNHNIVVGQGAAAVLSNPATNANLHGERNLRTGNKTVLIVRVVASSASNSFSTAELSDAILGTSGDSVNLASQYDACSHGQLTFQAATGSRIGTGNQAGTITVTVAGAATEDKVSNAVTSYFGTSPRNIADHVMYCMPPGSMSGIAYAYYNSWLSVFRDDWCTYPSVLLHEIGHNLNLGHSGSVSSEYEDRSCLMGLSYSRDDEPRMCFNAAKLWQLGWFSSRTIELDASGTTSYSGDIADMTQDPTDSSGKPVVIKMNTPSSQDYFLSFNRATDFNSGVYRGRDEVRIQQTDGGSGKSRSASIARASLSAGQSWTSDVNFSGRRVTVTVNSIGVVANVDICIGACAPTVSTPTASPTAPVPTPPSTTIEYVGNPCPDGKCTLCTGDCDEDNDCDGDLRCAQRWLTSGDENVPGCSWASTSVFSILYGDDDYCFLPTSENNVINYVGECGSENYLCGACEGDCDSDSDCEEGMVCVDRNGYEAVAGCSGEGGDRDLYGKDICVPTSPPVPTPTKSPTPPTPTDCVDFENRFRFDDGSGFKITRSCKWARNKSTKQRCSLDGVSEACPLTCGTCNTCVDPPSSLRFKFQNGGNSIARSCTWVEKKQTPFRCALTADICRATCGVC